MELSKLKNRKIPWVTYLICLCCCIIFFFECYCSKSTNINNLVLLKLGGELSAQHLTGFPFSSHFNRALMFIFDNRCNWIAMWLHQNIIHLVMNMIFLIFIGRLLEPLYGHIRFTLLYLMSGLLGDLSASLFGGANSITIGASGALFGLLSSGILLNVQLKRMSTAKSLFELLILNLICNLFQPDIALTGHLGGMVSGLIFGLILQPPILRKQDRFFQSLWSEIPLYILGFVIIVFVFERYIC